MSDTLAGLRHKLHSARQLASVVRAMKAVAATSIAQYEGAVTAVEQYTDSVELGLALALREVREVPPLVAAGPRPAAALIFGSDQGLVGRFNEVIAEFALRTLPTPPQVVWIVGERLVPHLSRVAITRRFAVPNSLAAITSLVTEIQVEMETHVTARPCPVHVFYNRPLTGARYEPSSEQLLPLDATWRKRLAAVGWPGGHVAEVLGGGAASLPMLVHEYLFISLYRACAESLASENASRLEAMQRAEKNIDTVCAELNRSLNRLRQSSIDEELFDLVAGFNAVGGDQAH